MACQGRKNYLVVLNSLACLRDEFKAAIAERNVNCTLPWIQSMQGVLGYRTMDPNLSVCRTREAYDLVDTLGGEFTKNASIYQHSKCPGDYYENKLITEVHVSPETHIFL